MPGAFRHYTLVDILGTLTDQSSQQTGDTINGLGQFAEADESGTVADSATATVQAPPGWGQSVWGGFVWQ